MPGAIRIAQNMYGLIYVVFLRIYKKKKNIDLYTAAPHLYKRCGNFSEQIHMCPNPWTGSENDGKLFKLWYTSIYTNTLIKNK